MVDTRADALERAAALGATRTVHTSEESAVDVVREMTDGRGADLTYEVMGVKAGELAGELTRLHAHDL
ncbi:MAG: zinc-binding dehydrogenase, partial [Acidimicrobiia bacterium]